MPKDSFIKYTAIVYDYFNKDKGVSCSECKYESHGVCLLICSEIPEDEEEMRENCPFCKGEVNGRCY